MTSYWPVWRVCGGPPAARLACGSSCAFTTVAAAERDKLSTLFVTDMAVNVKKSMTSM